jgi:hypothetical protein
VQVESPNYTHTKTENTSKRSYLMINLIQFTHDSLEYECAYALFERAKDIANVFQMHFFVLFSCCLKFVDATRCDTIRSLNTSGVLGPFMLTIANREVIQTTITQFSRDV